MEFIGKTLLIEEEGLRVLAVGDLHLGFADAARRAGKHVPMDLLGDMLSDLEHVFARVGKVNTVLLLGDVKHVFGRILPSEREEFTRLIGFLEKWCENIVVVRGNHDVLLEFMGVETVASYRFGEVCFVHGDKAVEGIDDAKVWVMGHGHPAVVLKDDVKEEKFSCFLDGDSEGRRVIVVPSFSPASVGSDPREFSLGLAWDFDLPRFLVRIVGDEGVVREMGMLKDL
ncbi:hypothetical protein CMO96_01650 [Candidatus Woesebacteria bacterium]|nr:hypothetical protein [Candidatus Woesebacteria bacterium]